MVYGVKPAIERLAAALGYVIVKGPSLDALHSEVSALQAHLESFTRSSRALEDKLRWNIRALEEKIRSNLSVSLPTVVDYWASVTKDFTFVQIGGFDGVQNDPIRDLVKHYHWRGTIVEPQKDMFELLRKNYRDEPQVVCQNLAIAEQDGERELYLAKKGEAGEPCPERQLASFHLDVLLKHRDLFPDIERYLVSEKVITATLPSALARAGLNKVNLLQIDAEGYDFHIIKSIPFERIKPTIIRYEHKHLSSADSVECVSLLQRKGYRVVLEHHEDTLAYLAPG